MKILCVVEHGNAPSTRLRLRDCLDYYAVLGVEATVVPTRRSSVTERLRVLKEARRHDVVVLFKTIRFNSTECTSRTIHGGWRRNRPISRASTSELCRCGTRFGHGGNAVTKFCNTWEWGRRSSRPMLA